MHCIKVYMSLSNGLECNEICTLPNCENWASASEESDNNEMTDGETVNEELKMIIRSNLNSAYHILKSNLIKTN